MAKKEWKRLSWVSAQRKKIYVEGKPVKVGVYIGIVAKKLQSANAVDKETGKPTDHHKNLRECYCDGGVEEMNKYISLVLNLVAQHNDGGEKDRTRHL